jgi:hypothetical protein
VNVHVRRLQLGVDLDAVAELHPGVPGQRQIRRDADADDDAGRLDPAARRRISFSM